MRFGVIQPSPPNTKTAGLTIVLIVTSTSSSNTGSRGKHFHFIFLSISQRAAVVVQLAQIKLIHKGWHSEKGPDIIGCPVAFMTENQITKFSNTGAFIYLCLRRTRPLFETSL